MKNWYWYRFVERRHGERKSDQNHAREGVPVNASPGSQRSSRVATLPDPALRPGFFYEGPSFVKRR